MAYTELTTLWSGFSGAPGYTKLKFSGDLDSAAVQTVAGRIRTFWNAVRAYIPSEATLSFSGVAQIFDAQGRLTDEVNYDPGAAIQGTSTGSYAGGAGLVINWSTGQFFQGRRVRGRTYVVPAGSAAFFTDGTLTSGTITAVTDAAAALLAGTPELVIAGGDETRGFYVFNVVGASVPDRSAVLRSRRD